MPSVQRGELLRLSSFVFCARSTTLLRDNKLTKGDLTLHKTDLGRVNADPSTTQAQKNVAIAEIQRIEAAVQKYSTYGNEWPIGTYSLGRTQMAVWFFLVIAAFVFNSMTIGQYLNLISANVLVLLGISGATGLAASWTPAITLPFEGLA
jgi:hypothetical protein